MLGFVTAMETFCGQAFGARRYALVGVCAMACVALNQAGGLALLPAAHLPDCLPDLHHSATPSRLAGLVLQRGLVISTLYCCAAVWMWQWNGVLLVAMGQVRQRAVVGFRPGRRGGDACWQGVEGCAADAADAVLGPLHC